MHIPLGVCYNLLMSNVNKTTSTSTQALINHISRLEGQLASVKTELMKTDPDCVKASNTLSAASRSFASLRHAFVRCFLEKKFIKHTKALDGEEYASLLSVVKS